MGGAGRLAVRIALWAVGLIVGGTLFFRFLLPCLFPFLLAFATAAICEPVVDFLTERAHIRRGIASALCVLVILSSVAGFFLLVVVRLADEAVGLVMSLPRLASGLPDIIRRVELTLDRVMDSAPEALRDYLDAAVNAIAQRAAQIPAALSQWVLERLSSAASRAPGTLLTLATWAIGSFFISAGFDDIRAFLIRQIPVSARDTARGMKRELLTSLGRWFRAEAALLGVTFAELTAAFMLMGVEYGVVIALITALIDALPVFGAGIVLLPWAGAALLEGHTGRAVALAVTYLVVTLVHSCLEPKLIGSEFGVAPAAALLAMYAGFKLTGVAGMVLFPFGLMLINELNTKGYVKLWKQAGKKD